MFSSEASAGGVLYKKKRCSLKILSNFTRKHLSRSLFWKNVYKRLLLFSWEIRVPSTIREKKWKAKSYNQEYHHWENWIPGNSIGYQNEILRCMMKRLNQSHWQHSAELLTFLWRHLTIVSIFYFKQINPGLLGRGLLF